MNFLRLIKSESYKRGTILSVLFNIISKGILFLLTIIIAGYFGTNIKTDIYFFVFAAMVLFSSFVNSIDTAVLIPESMRLRETEGEEKAAEFLNFFLLIYIIIGIFFTVSMYLFGLTVYGLISKFSATDIVTYRHYFLAGSLFFIFHVLTTYLNNILTSLKYFSLPLLINGIKNCIVIVGVLLLKSNYDMFSVIIGGLISYAVNLLVQIYVMHKIAGWKFIFKKPHIRKAIWGNVVYAELGQITTVASSLFPLYLLSGFASGIISVMNYGKNIADIPNTLITSQFSNVAAIKLNEQAARDDYAGMNETFLNTSKILVYILVPVGFFLFVLARPVVEIFYLRGNFTASSVEGATMFLQLLAASVFAIALNSMAARVFMALQRIKQAFIYQAIMSALLIIAIWFFVKYYGAYGYGYAVIILNLINLAGLFVICRIIAPKINYVQVLKYTALIVLLNGSIGAGIYYAEALLQMNAVVKIFILFGAWVLILTVLAKILRLKF